MKIIPKITAKATAREFPKNAYPLKIGGQYQRDRFGHLVATLDGKMPVLPLREIGNTDVFVTQGIQYVGDLLIAVKDTNLCYIAVGTGTTAPAIGDTDVEGQIGARHYYTDRFRTGNIITISTFFATGDNNGTWGNTGLFTALTGGDMFCHSTFASPVTKSTANTQIIDYDITIS